ncbi:ribonuclease III [Microbacterium paludicola]|uniref:Ribonuclease 3 n=1 Tax=Microbacterium paludicola TaxID=300019 RepID=A0A4Y9FZS9_9MICO|nr:ribonuclease III [Microbacterium paludicola]MBF0814810.1 ribonuclease III [Microbacterium paludicola]TFU34554.1 ribonuclease III [Microbacterium paludicola]
MTDSSRGPQHLTEKLGVEIDAELLGLALTHRSFAYENGGLPHNERLEFLGDSVLGLAVTTMLYTRHPDLEEGALAKRRASVVSTVALAEVARGIGLGGHIRLGRGEELTGGRDKDSILADAMEAVIGAAYLSAGSEAATAMVLRLIEPLLEDPERYGAAMDPKTALQEIAARQGLTPPIYVVTASGPDHERRFVATVSVGEHSATGEGTSKKTAEMAAALDLWRGLSERARA